MLKLSDRELREFGTRGYAIVRNVIPAANLKAASTEIDRLIRDQPPPVGYVGHHLYSLSTLDGGPDALVESKGYPEIELPEPVQILGGPGDVLLAHYMLGHNIGGNYASDKVRRAVYFRLRRVGHAQRWRECLCDELLEFDAVRVALDRT